MSYQVFLLSMYSTGQYSTYTAVHPRLACSEMADKDLTSQIFLFDMETTGLDRMVDQVCQISAVPFYKEPIDRQRQADIFNVYILPDRKFHPEASKINGFSIVENGDTRELYKQGKPLPTVSLQEAYSSFFEYLKQKTPPEARIVLTGYNSKSFDISFLRRDCHKCGVTVAVEGRELHFADAFLLICAIRDTVLPGINSLSQQAVHQYLCPHSEGYGEFHDGVDDVLRLADILRSPKIPLQQLFLHEFECFPKRKPTPHFEEC